MVSNQNRDHKYEVKCTRQNQTMVSEHELKMKKIAQDAYKVTMDREEKLAT